MEHKLTEKELKSMMSFLVEAFGFSDEQMAAIDHQIPMTQELFDAIIDRCNELGEGADKLFFRMLDEYPDFMIVGAERIKKEVAREDF